MRSGLRLVPFLLPALVVVLPDVSAKQAATILVEDLIYTVKSVPDSIAAKTKGQLVYAEGVGTLDCNNVAACHDAGMHGGPVSVAQAFITGDGTLVEVATQTPKKFKVGTVGRLQLPGKLGGVEFKGAGMASAQWSSGVRHVTLDLHAGTKQGGRLIFGINIDHTSAGVMLDFSGALTATPGKAM